MFGCDAGNTTCVARMTDDGASGGGGGGGGESVASDLLEDVGVVEPSMDVALGYKVLFKALEMRRSVRQHLLSLDGHPMRHSRRLVCERPSECACVCVWVGMCARV
jgi:hypothetical protein